MKLSQITALLFLNAVLLTAVDSACQTTVPMYLDESQMLPSELVQSLGIRHGFVVVDGKLLPYPYFPEIKNDTVYVNNCPYFPRPSISKKPLRRITYQDLDWKKNQLTTKFKKEYSENPGQRSECYLQDMIRYDYSRIGNRPFLPQIIFHDTFAELRFSDNTYMYLDLKPLKPRRGEQIIEQTNLEFFLTEKLNQLKQNLYRETLIAFGKDYIVILEPSGVTYRRDTIQELFNTITKAIRDSISINELEQNLQRFYPHMHYQLAKDIVDNLDTWNKPIVTTPRKGNR